MTVAVVVALLVAFAGGGRWLWMWRTSGPRLRVTAQATWLPGPFRDPSRPGVLLDQMNLFQVIVRSGPRAEDVTVERWGFVSRSGAVMYPHP